MNSSRYITLAINTFLFLLEYIFKFIAGVISIIVLGGQGSFLGKLGVGFGSLFEVLNRIFTWPGKLSYISSVVNDYNTLTASEFNQRYGGQAITRVMESLNEAVTYFQSVYQNLTQQPFATVFATLLAFFAFYFCARVLRFARQKGEGSYLVRKEREIGDRVFRSPEM